MSLPWRPHLTLGLFPWRREAVSSWGPLWGETPRPDPQPPGLRGLRSRPSLTGQVGAAVRRSVDGRLSGVQAELVQQEENRRRAERECRAVLDRVATLERSLQGTESELQASQVGRGRAAGGGLDMPAGVSVSAPVCGCL